MSRAPQVMVFHGNNVGDKNQAETLARLIGFDYRMVRIQRPGKNRNPSPPKLLPDIIIAADKRCTDAAIALKRASRRPVKVIKIGAPYLLGPPRLFGMRPINPDVDLHLTYEQYDRGSPGAARVVEQELPFSPIDPSEFEEARRSHPQLSTLPAPRIAVLVGGRNRYFQWSPRIAAELGRTLNAAAAEAGGSLLISTSYRTGAACAGALLAEITVPHAAFRWDEGETDNPLRAYLAYADRTVVTMDSIAMLADALNAGKPVSVYPLKARRLALLKEIVERVMPVSGRTAIIRKLMKSGEITWFGDQPAAPRLSYRERYAAAVEAARSLIGEAAQQP